MCSSLHSLSVVRCAQPRISILGLPNKEKENQKFAGAGGICTCQVSGAYRSDGCKKGLRLDCRFDRPRLTASAINNTKCQPLISPAQLLTLFQLQRFRFTTYRWMFTLTGLDGNHPSPARPASLGWTQCTRSRAIKNNRGASTGKDEVRHILGGGRLR